MINNFENVDIDIFEVVFASGLDGEIANLRVTEGARGEGFVGGTKESTINPDKNEGVIVCAVFGVQYN